MAYLDNSGLYVKIGPEATIPQAGGEYKTYGEDREIEVTIDLTKVTSTAGTNLIGSDNIFFPAGLRIEQVEIVVDTAATSGGSATLDIGFVRTDRSTAIDADGLVAAATLASMNAVGKKIVYNVGSTSAGALIGTSLSNVGQFCVNYSTAAFTAGVIRVRVKYYRP